MNATANFNHNKANIIRQYVLFTQELSLFAVEMTLVREVLFLHEQAITSVPNALPFLLGLTNLRGEIIAVADFGCFIGGTSIDTSLHQGRILVIEAPDPRDVKLPPIRLGLAVSQVEGVLSLDTDEIVSTAGVSEELIPFLRGLYDYQGRLLMIVDVEAIASWQDRW